MRLAATAFTTRGIWDRGEAVLMVCHETDGSWQFLPGAEVSVDDAIAIHVAHVLERHPDLTELADLPPGWTAERGAVTVPWHRYESPDME